MVSPQGFFSQPSVLFLIKPQTLWAGGRRPGRFLSLRCICSACLGTSHEHPSSIPQRGKKRGFIQHVAPGQINSNSLAKFPFCAVPKSFAASPLCPPSGRSSAGLVRGGGSGIVQVPGEGKGKEKRLQMFNAVHISAALALFIIIPFSASDVSLLPTGFGEIAAGNELEKHQTVWVFFKKSLAPLRYLMNCGQLSERRINLLRVWP